MGRTRSFKVTKECLAPPAEEAPPSLPFWSFSFLILGLAIASLSGYELSKAPTKSVKSMWIEQLFSEYIPPGSVHLHLIRERNDFSMENDVEPPGLWDLPKSYGWKPCLDTSLNTLAKHRDQQRYLQVFCTGGLFQLHICVCNAVTVAWLLNASLVIPYFQESVVWKDPRCGLMEHINMVFIFLFQDIYDLDHFRSTLKKEVHVIHQLPPEFSWSTPEYYEGRCLERPNCFFFIPKHARKEWYFENVLPAFESHGVAVLDRYHHKLAFEGLPNEATRLRCKTNFSSLRFVRPIMDLAHKLVKRLQLKAKLLQKGRGASFFPPYGNGTQTLVKHVNGHFLGLHLRFEKDMIAHSACYYGGGRAEQHALASYRRKTFKSFVPKAQFSAEYLRRNGSCPLTPEEVGLLLAGLGFKNVTPIYVAGKLSDSVSTDALLARSTISSGSRLLVFQRWPPQFDQDEFDRQQQIHRFPVTILSEPPDLHETVYPSYGGQNSYGGEARVKPLRDVFPHLETKVSLASQMELQWFIPFSHRLAALDFMVLLQSDAFLSNSAGNFPNVLTGQRTFKGPRISIHPNKAALFALFSNTSLTWGAFSEHVKFIHKDRQGAPYPRKERYSTYRYPAPDCMCRELTKSSS
ncbi:hypothetical protein L7F22_057295 [Adiantum nelumboides]|nr:hypothetical protein [Adiantum nelumboides]